ncbi:MAG: TIM barrel protein, partial [Merdibacter sp.]
HAPYIINLANTIKPETFDLGVRFLRQELERVQALGVRVLVLHPGAHLKEGEEKGLAKIVEGLDLAMEG